MKKGIRWCFASGYWATLWCGSRSGRWRPFDRDGYRLGYGGGFYDRTLDRLRARKEVTAVGVAFAAQELDSVPHDSSDARLDLIVTENEVIRP